MCTNDQLSNSNEKQIDNVRDVSSRLLKRHDMYEYDKRKNTN